MSYSYYDRIDAVTYKGWVDGDTHNVDTEGNLRRSFIGTKILPPLNQLDDDRYLKRSLALSLADLAMDIRRLPIDGQLKLF